MHKVSNVRLVESVVDVAGDKLGNIAEFEPPDETLLDFLEVLFDRWNFFESVS